LLNLQDTIIRGTAKVWSVAGAADQPIICIGNVPHGVGHDGEGLASEPQPVAAVAAAEHKRSLAAAGVMGQKRSAMAVVAADKARQRSARNAVQSHTSRRASPNLYASPNRRANRLGTSRRHAILPLKQARQV
jgi:hypothetical protein